MSPVTPPMGNTGPKEAVWAGYSPASLKYHLIIESLQPREKRIVP